MNSLQYTIRAITPTVDKALRDKARLSGKSLNQVALDALAREAGVSQEVVVHHDLDWFVGSKMLDDNFDEAMAWLDSAPKEIT